MAISDSPERPPPPERLEAGEKVSRFRVERLCDSHGVLHPRFALPGLNPTNYGCIKARGEAKLLLRHLDFPRFGRHIDLPPIKRSRGAGVRQGFRLPVMIATPNATMRAIRIYGSESQWGKEARWTPPHQPYEAFDFPQEGCVGRIFFGEVPDQICQQIHARHAFANACLNRLMGGDEASLDEAVEAAKAAQSMPVYDEEAWYVTLVFDQPVYLPESPNTPSAYAWWDTDRVSRADQKFRAIADQSLNALAGHCSLVMEPIFFETRVTERDLVIILADGRPVSFVPRLVGSARIAVGKDADNFPTDELQDRLRSLTAGTVQAHQSLRQAVGWWVASLSMNNQWQKFQAAFLALELLTEKLAPRYRDKVSARLEYRDYGSLGRPLAELIVSEAGGKRMPLVSKFAIVALQLDPANADQDLCEFRAAKKARDGLAHGSISQAEDLPVGQIFDLARKYLALALLRTAPD